MWCLFCQDGRGWYLAHRCRHRLSLAAGRFPGQHQGRTRRPEPPVGRTVRIKQVSASPQSRPSTRVRRLSTNCKQWPARTIKLINPRSTQANAGLCPRPGTRSQELVRSGSTAMHDASSFVSALKNSPNSSESVPRLVLGGSGTRVSVGF